MANMTSAVKTLVDALTTDPASTETSLVNHASHHDVVHTALQEIYDKTYYVANVTQESTSAPTATQLENSTGATMTWSYVGVGQYRVTASSAVFLSGKTFVSHSALALTTTTVQATYQSSTAILIETKASGVAANDLLSGIYFKIELYS